MALVPSAQDPHRESEIKRMKEEEEKRKKEESKPASKSQGTA